MAVTLLLGRQPYIYRPQMKFEKVMFSQVFVCPQWGWGVSVSVQGVSIRGVSVHAGGGLCPWGVSVWGVSLCLGWSLSRETPLVRGVRNLLECILVFSNFHKIFIKLKKKIFIKLKKIGMEGRYASGASPWMYQ